MIWQMYVNLIIVETWLSEQYSDYQSSELVLQAGPGRLRYSRREPFKTTVDIQHHLVVLRVVGQLLLLGHRCLVLQMRDAHQPRPYSSPHLCNC